MMIKIIRFFSGILFLFWVAVPVLTAQNQIDEGVSYRKSVMTALGGHLGAIAHIIRGQLSEYRPNLITHIRLLQQTYKMVPNTFPQNSRRAQSRSKAEIWEQPDKFRKALEATGQAGTQLSAISKDADWRQLAQSLRVLRNSCKECHQYFRKKKR